MHVANLLARREKNRCCNETNNLLFICGRKQNPEVNKYWSTPLGGNEATTVQFGTGTKITIAGLAFLSRVNEHFYRRLAQFSCPLCVSRETLCESSTDECANVKNNLENLKLQTFELREWLILLCDVKYALQDVFSCSVCLRMCLIVCCAARCCVRGDRTINYRRFTYFVIRIISKYVQFTHSQL